MPNATRALVASTRRAVLGSCLALSVVAASIPARAENPPNFKDAEVTAVVQKISDIFDGLEVAFKAGDSAKLEELANQLDALEKDSTSVITAELVPRTDKATPAEIATYQKWMATERGTNSFFQFTTHALATKSLAKAKQIGLALKLWASDNGGAYPKSLDALFPMYVSDRSLLISPFKASEPLGYTYHSGFTDSDDPKKVLVEDKFAPGIGGLSVIVHLDDSGEITK